MKKLLALLVLGLALIFSTRADASVKSTYQVMNDSDGTAMSAYTFSTAKTTEAIQVSNNTGFASLIIDVTSGTIDSITYEVSMDGTNWYTPYTTDGTTATTAGSITTADFTADRWIVLTARLANYVRFTITPSGSTVITASFVFQSAS
jgi:hypothetical protein